MKAELTVKQWKELRKQKQGKAARTQGNYGKIYTAQTSEPISSRNKREDVKGNKPKPISEAQLQAACIRWFRYQYPEIIAFHAANGGSRHKLEAINLRRQGVLPGVSDIIIMHPSGRHHGACFELKVGKNKLSDHQKDFLKKASVAGYYCDVIYTLEEFITAVQKYFNIFPK